MLSLILSILFPVSSTWAIEDHLESVQKEIQGVEKAVSKFLYNAGENAPTSSTAVGGFYTNNDTWGVGVEPNDLFARGPVPSERAVGLRQHQNPFKERRKIEMKIAGAVLLGFLIAMAGFLVAPRAEAGPEDFGFRNFDEVIRADLRAKHAELIARVMQFPAKEAGAFWPIFRDYERELMKLNDEKIQIIIDYAQSYENMTDEKANELAERSLDFQAGRVKLMRHYYKKFNKAFLPRTAAKFLQLENQLLLLIDLQIASEMPLVK